MVSILLIAMLRKSRVGNSLCTLTHSAFLVALAAGSAMHGLPIFSSLAAEVENNKLAVSDRTPSPSVYRSPVDLILTSDETLLLTANQTSGTISLVDVASGLTIDQQACGDGPSNLGLTSDGKYVLVTAWFSGYLSVFELSERRLKPVASLRLGHEPRGIAISPDGKTAYVALTTANEIAVVDLSQLGDEQIEVVDRIAVGRWPRFLGLSQDGNRLAVGCTGDGGVAVIDTRNRTQLFIEDFAGLNLGLMQISADGKHVYFPWIVYRQNPITSTNIRRGWVIASRIARVQLDEQARREAISLDPEGKAIGDPHGIALSPDENTLVCTASGTHELLVYRLPGLPFQDYGGPGDHINEDLLADRQRFDRIPLGGRPMAVRYSQRGEVVYIANYLLDAVQVVNVAERKLVRTIELSSEPESNSTSDDTRSLVRQGEAIFYDAQRSFDQWFSCHSCHYEGHTNAVAMDTLNDDRSGNFKTVLSLRGVADTGPWFWHGWSSDLEHSVKKSMIDTMLGEKPTDHDVHALTAFIKTLKWPSNPNRQHAEQAEQTLRGEAIFRSEKAGCATCHSGPFYTDGQMHDVGTGESDDAFDGYNTPSLRGVFDRTKWIHDGRAASLEALLRGPHNPAQVTGLGELTDEELKDLLQYIKTL